MKSHEIAITERTIFGIWKFSCIWQSMIGLLRNLGFYLYHCIFVNHGTMILTLNKIAYNSNQNN